MTLASGASDAMLVQGIYTAQNVVIRDQLKYRGWWHIEATSKST
ncbi:MAG: hypothetical protein VXY07_13350 [Planctomycetota bacterium]|nr:hypothetical protein [Planctomycetota bacterium]MEC7604144.1 hypothetical protein [Planctomycetota bacterium]MEC7716404.1 hypothetical protein [Planctomycetota bacterium]MEC7977943.1 hypothetical protein [Planctomycetota bacterium]MEC8160933.1 hypothetical protein [Planctomycetota bacterium]